MISLSPARWKRYILWLTLKSFQVLTFFQTEIQRTLHLKHTNKHMNVINFTTWIVESLDSGGMEKRGTTATNLV